MYSYSRGHAEDYNRWEREGATGWSYEDVLPYFKKAQTHSDGGDDYRGHDGPLHVTRYEAKSELHQAWLKAGQQAGDRRLLNDHLVLVLLQVTH